MLLNCLFDYDLTSVIIVSEGYCKFFNVSNEGYLKDDSF